MQRAIPKTFQIFHQHQKGCKSYCIMKELIVLLGINNSLPTNIESPRQSNSILWRTISFGSSGLFQLFRMWPYPKYWNIIFNQDNYMQDKSKYNIKIYGYLIQIKSHCWILTCNWVVSSVAASIAGGAS